MWNKGVVKPRESSHAHAICAYICTRACVRMRIRTYVRILRLLAPPIYTSLAQHYSMDQRSGSRCALACPCCVHSAKKVVDLFRHIRLLHFGTPGFTSLKCNLEGCQRTFRKFTVFRNHIYQIHSDSQLLQPPNRYPYF